MCGLEMLRAVAFMSGVLLSCSLQGCEETTDSGTVAEGGDTGDHTGAKNDTGAKKDTGDNTGAKKDTGVNFPPLLDEIVPDTVPNIDAGKTDKFKTVCGGAMLKGYFTKNCQTVGKVQDEKTRDLCKTLCQNGGFRCFAGTPECCNLAQAQARQYPMMWKNGKCCVGNCADGHVNRHMQAMQPWKSSSQITEEECGAHDNTERIWTGQWCLKR